MSVGDREPDDALSRARRSLAVLRSSPAPSTECEESEGSEESPARRPAADAVDPFLRWRLLNAERMTADDLAHGYDAGGYCTKHGRVLSYPEQKRGACSWCVPVDPEREPEYWVSHWRRFKE